MDGTLIKREFDYIYINIDVNGIIYLSFLEGFIVDFSTS